MRKPGQPVPMGGTCERHGLPIIHGEAGCFHCLYTIKRGGKTVPKPERAPAKPKPEPKSDHCKGCGTTVAPRCEWCSSCRPGDRVRDAVRKCGRCGGEVRGFYARICDACRDPSNATALELCSRRRDERNKEQRRARGLKGRKWVQWQGEELCVAEVARREGVKTDAVYWRLKKGLTIAEAVEGARRLG